MSKLSIGLHSISLVAGIVAIWLTFSTVSRYEKEQILIQDTETQISGKKQELEELRKEISSSILREKNRLLDEADELASIQQENDLNTKKLDEVKSEITKSDQHIEELKSLAVSYKQDQNASLKELQIIQNKIMRLRQEIPSIEAETREIVSRADQLNREIAESGDRMSIFSAVTEAIKDHYARTTSALRTYSRERPWLEPGEVLNLELKGIDLSSGLIALPKGSSDGIRDQMLFAVHSNNKPICKIRIKQAFRTHALAEVVPLVGRPIELLELEYVDLVVL